MKKFNKESIKRFIKIFLLVSSSMYGFWWNYLFILHLFGAPLNIWTLLISVILGVASTWGLFYWIARD